jgi:hypothetical protein
MHREEYTRRLLTADDTQGAICSHPPLHRCNGCRCSTHCMSVVTVMMQSLWYSAECAGMLHSKDDCRVFVRGGKYSSSIGLRGRRKVRCGATALDEVDSTFADKAKGRRSVQMLLSKSLFRCVETLLPRHLSLFFCALLSLSVCSRCRMSVTETSEQTTGTRVSREVLLPADFRRTWIFS